MERANSGVTHHEGEMLASLVHEPLGSLDWISHPLYDYRIRSLVSIEEMTPSVAEKYLDNFRPLGDYDRLARAASELPGGKEELGRLAGGIILWERIHGFPISKSWHEKWSRLFQSNQEPDHGLRARLLTDLRAVDNSMPGSFMLPTYDSVNRNRMWVHFQSYEDKPSYARSQMHSSAVRRQPWLVGFDCITGEINRRVNLSNGPGLDPGSAAATSLRGYHQDDGFIVQTNEQILTGVLWPGMDENRAKVKEASFLINKSDGKMTPLENGIIVGAPMDKVNSTKYSVGAVAIDKEFFVLHEARHIQDQPRTRYVPFELSRISPDGKVSPLTVIGRRPELSPFDPKDRLPRMIFRDGGNLLVIHEWDHLGRYDPKQESWIMDEADPNKKKASARALVSQDYRKHIFPSHNVKGEKKDDKTYVIRWDLGFPDKLAFYDPSKRELRVGLELEIPDNFRNQPIMAGPIVTRTGQQHKFGTYDQPDESHKYCIVVLNQTKDDIILGLQFGGGYKWYPGKRVGLFLPLVWALPKEDFLAAAAAASATKITNPEKK
jgi:hypothetical protein